MQLDKTEIVIRQRSALELLDLSLVVLRRHAASIIVTSALIGVPLLMFDVWSIAWMLNEESYLAAEHLNDPGAAMFWRHTIHLVLLYVVQFQLISLPTTIFLGNQIFFEPISIGKIIGKLWKIAWRCFLVIGILRLGLVTLMMEFLIDRNTVFDMLAEFWSLVVLSAIAILLRACWPFAPEILGLELCPLHTKKKGEISYSARSRGLHKLLLADHFARFAATMFFSGLLALMLIASALLLKGLATGGWQWNAWFDHVVLPLSLWCVGLFVVVFRFLSYLDSRIRLEGWEIELRLRAEADRMNQATRAPSTGSTTPTEQVAT